MRRVRPCLVMLALAALPVVGCDRGASAPATGASPGPAAPAAPGGGASATSATAADASAAIATAPPRATELVVDGIRLGDRYGSTVMTRDPYREPCDDDGIEDRRRRAMVYGGLPCRDHVFPDRTTVVFLIEYADHDAYDQPVRVIAWMGGGHFDDRVALPFHVGAPAADVATRWGAPADVLHTDNLEARRYGDDLFVLVEADTVVGFVLGPMPLDPGIESWGAIDQMYRRYTPRPDPGNVSRDDCERALRHAWTFERHDRDDLEARLPAKIEKCLRKATPAQIACVLAATSMDEVNRCK
ncbi:MAG: hypothetical protein H6709_08020 [Kofleriaceae bacterium]|nr:hypothetical protein [Kofleriaceae bacterium]